MPPDQFVERTHKTLAYEKASRRDAISLRNWLSNTRCVARDECNYITHEKELFSVSMVKDSAMLRFEAWVEDKLIRFSRWRPIVRRRPYPLKQADRYQKNFDRVSTDADVFIYSGPWIKRIARALMLSLVTILLLMPIVVCNILTSTQSRIIVVMISTLCYLLFLARMTRSKTIELIVAGTT